MKENMNPLLNMQTDAASSAAADAIHRTADGITPEEEKRRMRKAALIKMLAMIVFVICLIVFNSIAWFASNKLISTDGMAVSVKGIDFILRVDPHPSVSSLTPSNPVEKAKFETYYPIMSEKLRGKGYDLSALNTSAADAIRWYMIDSNQAYTDKTGLRPGSYGTLQFYVTPVNTENFTAMDMTFKLSMISFGNEYDADGIVTDITEISSSAAVSKNLNSHILFFENKDANGYSGLIDKEQGFTKRITSTNYTDPIVIHWIWPNTFGQMVLFDGDSDLNDAAMFSNNQTATISYTNWQGTTTTGAPIDIMKDYIIANYDIFFKDVSWDGNTDAAHKADVAAKLSDIKNNIVFFNTGYNNADQAIGLNVGCVMLEMSVS